MQAGDLQPVQQSLYALLYNGAAHALTCDHLWLANHSVLQEPAKHDSVIGGFGLCSQKFSFTDVFLMSTHVTALCLIPRSQVTEH